MRLGILTGGGDTPSLNAILYGAATRAESLGHTLIGFRKGWSGVTTDVVNYLALGTKILNPYVGGTLIKTSRVNPEDETLEKIADNIGSIVDGLIAVGGDDTLSVARRLLSKSRIPICFITKTIDNDVGMNSPKDLLDYGKIANYFTTGFATAAFRAASFAADLRTTAYSHDRVVFLETMGRTPGWLALSSYEGNPDFILVPEVGLDFERFKIELQERYSKKGDIVVVVAEGVRYDYSQRPIVEDAANMDVFGHARLGGVAAILAERIKKELGIKNSNYVNPSYLYRSGSPTEVDRTTSMLLGTAAVDTLNNGINGTLATIQRQGDALVAACLPIQDVLLVGDKRRIIPRNLDLRFYDPVRYEITAAGREYFRVLK